MFRMWVNNYKVDALSFQALRGVIISLLEHRLFISAIPSEPPSLTLAATPNGPPGLLVASTPCFALLLFFCPPSSSTQWCSLAVLHVSDGKESSPRINGLIYISSLRAGACLNMCLTFGPSSILAILDCIPTYPPWQREASLLEFILSSEKPCAMKYVIFIS